MGHGPCSIVFIFHFASLFSFLCIFHVSISFLIPFLSFLNQLLDISLLYVIFLSFLYFL
jgi:hypothetical protein